MPNTLRGVAPQRAPPLRSRQRLLSAVARSPSSSTPARISPTRDDVARRGAAGEARSGLPQAAAAARRDGRRGRMRLGRAGAAHGAALRRDASRPSTSRGEQLALRARARRCVKGSTIASSSSTTTTATSGGTFDAFVSVGMLEHVGLRHLPTLADVLRRTVRRDGGRGLLHFIGRDVAAAAEPWIRRRIFPGAYTPTLAEVDRRACSRRPACRSSTSRICVCTTRGRWRIGASGSRRRRSGCARTMATSSRAPGSCTSPDRRRRSRPGGCSCSRWSSRRAESAPPSWTRADLHERSGVTRMIRCDALVVGGGPAGSTCARALRVAGWNVVVADRAPFPRDKVCAGWLTPGVFPLLELDPEEYRASGTDAAGDHRLPHGRHRPSRPIETRYPRVVSYAIRRCEFDDFLLRRAGARVIERPASRDAAPRPATRGSSTSRSRRRSSSAPAGTSAPSPRTCAAAPTRRSAGRRQGSGVPR